jgi:hypothetical protein
MAQPPHQHPQHGGGVQDEAALDAKLTAAGYTNVTNVEHHGHSWHCTATDAQGNSVQLIVDGHGNVHIDDEPPAPAPAPGA